MDVISVNKKFAKACRRLEGDVESIFLSHSGEQRGECITVERKAKNGSYHTDLSDYHLNVAAWRHYGKSFKASNKIKELWLKFVDMEVSLEAARCFEAFLKEMKENISVETFHLGMNISPEISLLDLRYFLRNNNALTEVCLSQDSERPVSPRESANISAALRDVSLEKLRIYLLDYTNNGAFEQILMACRKMKGLHFLWLTENYQFTALAELIRDPTGSLEVLEIKMDRDRSPNLDLERAEREIFSSLTQNTQLKKLHSIGFLDDEEATECFETLLCNKANIESICQSNHTLQEIDLFHLHDGYLPVNFQQPGEQYLKLNKNPNKKKVMQAKIIQFYFSGDFDVSSIGNMPLGLLAEILGIGVQKKQSAVYNILKSVPELCGVSSRDGVHLDWSSNNNGGYNKRQRVGS